MGSVVPGITETCSSGSTQSCTLTTAKRCCACCNCTGRSRIHNNDFCTCAWTSCTIRYCHGVCSSAIHSNRTIVWSIAPGISVSLIQKGAVNVTDRPWQIVLLPPSCRCDRTGRTSAYVNCFTASTAASCCISNSKCIGSCTIHRNTLHMRSIAPWIGIPWTWRAAQLYRLTGTNCIVIAATQCRNWTGRSLLTQIVTLQVLRQPLALVTVSIRSYHNLHWYIADENRYSQL